MIIMNNFIRCVMCACSLIGVLASGCAQRIQIAGQVTDASGRSIPRAMVSVSSSGYTVMTDHDGLFVIDREAGQLKGDQGALTEKVYELSVEVKGYETLNIPVDTRAGGDIWAGQLMIKRDRADVKPVKPIQGRGGEGVRVDRGEGGIVGI